jgi:hypothetical protein
MGKRGHDGWSIGGSGEQDGHAQRSKSLACSGQGCGGCEGEEVGGGGDLVQERRVRVWRPRAAL